MRQKQTENLFICRDVRLKIVQETYWTTLDRYNALSNITINDLKLFSRDFFQHVKIQALIQGNILKQDAMDVMSRVLDNLNCGGIENVSDQNHLTTTG